MVIYMAKNITKQKVGKISLLDGFLIAGSKVGTEMLIAQTPLGNGTFRSGFSKVAGAIGLNMLAGQFGAKRQFSAVATGMLIDGFEDVVTEGRRRITSGQGFGGLLSGNQSNGQVERGI